ncbi:uncharacterized protein HMPREF1541_02287 [Cyphellophora europaea CBS 101466]|uniref:Mitochondrial adapter protein MCP1 transmembrane domain-containing protein n=1 Tax=Cyphellophora europaea (strain CBS 101466) TaxID=1220924 RepID=W2S599_CYPE1|nr:uncharacterized protein HMPREF1541_02287 [Cyphellophora europaea CBS 101466]ETN43129.1 hypothetical protein HMPREF1541_02287 [Cyphellophora europaea CBS 101466]
MASTATDPDRESRTSISAIPMHELEPSPVDEETDPFDSSASLPLPATSKKTTSSTNFLGLTPSRTIHLLSSIQKYATVGPSIYLTLHYANTALIPLFTQSLHKSDNLLLLTRPYYQSFPIEPLLIFAPVVAHVASGIALRVYRRRQNAKRHGAETHSERRRIPWPKLSLTSALGYALYPMFVAHVLVNRITPQKVDGGSSGVGLRYFAYGVARHPVLANLGYVAMLGVASWHFVGGAAKYLRVSREYVTEGGDYGARKRRRRGWIVNALSAVVAGAWIAGGLGVVGRGKDGGWQSWETANWDRIYKAVPLVGRWM